MGLSNWLRRSADEPDPQYDPHPGLDLNASRVRAAAKDISRIYFFLVSGFDDQAHVDAGTAAGADEYQCKPLDLDRLEASLQTASTIWWRAPC